MERKFNKEKTILGYKERVKHVKSLIESAKDTKGIFAMAHVPHKYWPEIQCLIDLEYVKKLSRGFYHLANPIPDEDIGTIAEYSLEWREEYQKKRTDTQNEKKRYLETLAQRKEPEVVEVPAPVTTPAEAPVPSPFVKTTKYKIFGITFTKTEVIQ
jgi:hypothetical protein